MTEKVLPKYLKQTATGRIYAYSDELAKRADMVPHSTELVVEPIAETPDLTPDVKPVIEENGEGIKGAGGRSRSGIKRKE